MNKVLIYSEQSTERLMYVLDFILESLLGLTYELTIDKAYFSSYTGPKFSYAKEPVDNELFFEAAALLFETKINHQPIFFCEQGQLVGLYAVTQRSAICFDMFASSFFMLSRYKEYLPHKKDKYDRYRSSQSMNYKAGFLERPMVNHYALELKKTLSEKYPQLQFKQNKFEYVPTFDIDMAYSYLEKGAAINTASFIRSFLLSDFKDVKSRFMVLARGRRDPFDNFDYMLNVCKEFGQRAIFFFLLGDKSRFDKNISHTNSKFRGLIKSIAAQAEVGIHLSYKSHMAEWLMKNEVERLQQIIGKKVTANRFHYLRFQIPISYRKLVKLGITEDYSMAYAPRPGFRAGTCSPFYFFDLQTNKRTALKVYPFAFMDTTFTTYNKLAPAESLEKILQLMRSVKEVEGTLMGLWHNSSFTETAEWTGWKNVFESVAYQAELLTEKK